MEVVEMMVRYEK